LTPETVLALLVVLVLVEADFEGLELSEIKGGSLQRRDFVLRFGTGLAAADLLG